MTGPHRSGIEPAENLPGGHRVAANKYGETRMADDVTDSSQTVAAGQLRAFIERIERFEEEKKTIADDIKEVYAELKGTGFEPKAVRTIIRLRIQIRIRRAC